MKIYHAHPAFTEEQKANKAKLVVELSHLGNRLVDPFDYSPSVEGDRDTKKQLSGSILFINETLVKSCDILLACIDDRDQGVIFEMGLARASNKLVISYSYKDFDVNLMLSKSVHSHIPNVLEEPNMSNLLNILEGLDKTYDFIKFG